MPDTIIDQVQEKYGAVALSGLTGGTAGVQTIAQAFGYSAEELASIPAEANMGLSCGNPTAFASLRPGETVVDLGSGGGLDVFLAAIKVGPSGRAIGIDMTADMIERARRGAEKQKLRNVEFHLATIDNLPLADNSVDCVISNCVINLAPDKPAVFREIFRVLRPGGRLAASDIALKRPLPEAIGRNLLAYIGCVAGAILIEDYEKELRRIGFQAIQIVDTQKDLNVYAQVENQTGCCAPAPVSSGLPLAETCCSTSGADSISQVHRELADLFRRYNVNDYAASVQVYAVK
jgi:arsenite methyltransferase